MKTIPEALKSQINLYGELHLVKPQVDILMNYIDMQNRHIADIETHFKALVKTLNDAGIVDASVVEKLLSSGVE